MAAPIVTPEAVVLQFETAGIGSRMLAGLLDLAIQVGLFIGGLSGLALVASFDAFGALEGIASALVYILVFLVLFGYPVLLETLWRGRTVGKAALGLRVVTVEGAPIRFRHAAIRSILGLVDWYATNFTVGIVALLVTKRNQRIGDLVAGTMVLRERSAASSPQPMRFTPPRGLESYAATLTTAVLDHDDYGAVRSFLLRASTFPAAVRGDLAVRLADPLVERLRTTPPPGVDAEAFLVCIAASYQQRMAGPAGRATGAPFLSVWGTLPTAATHAPHAAQRTAPAPTVAPRDGYAPPA
ncbi:MAG TPA: RDD family protein [Acidimicrobiales bacterium]